LLCALALGLAVPHSLSGQAYRRSTFGQDQGLDNLYVYCFQEDATGFLWLGTGDGLVRFDGAKFRTFHREDGIAENHVRSSLLDSKKRVWFGHYGGGITVWDGRNFLVVDTISANSAVQGFAEMPDGSMMVATQRDGLLFFSTDLKLLKQYREPLSEQFVRTISGIELQGVKYHEVLVGTEEGLMHGRITNDQLSLESLAGFPAARVTSICPSSLSSVYYIGTEENGIYLWDGPGRPVRPLLLPGLAAEEKISSLREDRQGNLWIGTTEHGFRKFRHQGLDWREVTSLDGSDTTLSKAAVQSIYQDRFYQIWLGTFGNGVICLSPEIFTLYRPQNNNPNVNINASLEDRHGNFWFASDFGIYRVDSSRISDYGYAYTFGNRLPLEAQLHLTSADGLPDSKVTALLEDRQGNLWLGTETKGLCRLDPSTLEIERIPLSELELCNAVNDLAEDQRGYIWVATRDGAFLYDPSDKSFEYYNTQSGLTHNNISTIFPDKGGKIWFATRTNKISVFNGKAFEPHEIKSEYTIPEIRCVTEDANGNVWMGTDGLGAFMEAGDSFTNYTADQGLASNYVYLITPDLDNNIWFGHRNGFTRYIQSTQTFLVYPYSHYFPFQQTSIRSVFRDRTGNLWFGTQEGVIKYSHQGDPFTGEAPKIMITDISLFDKNEGLPESLDLPYGSYRMKFNFLGLTFLNQSAVKYKYMLEGRDQDWSEETTNPFVTYQGLTDGSYTFKVIACNQQGIWNKEPATFSFVIGLPWWKKWWFIALVVLAVAASVLLFVRYRTRQLAKEKEKLELVVQERTSELQAEKEKLATANFELDKLSLVAKETDNAVFIIDEKGMVEYVNPGFERITGISSDEYMARYQGISFLDFSTYSGIRQLLDEAVRLRKSVRYESTLPGKDGKLIPVISTLNVITDDHGNLRKVVIIDSDISEQKAAEEQIKNMNAELEKLVAARTQQLADAYRTLQEENEDHIHTARRLEEINLELDTFVYRASHDLKGPLASLLGLVNIARLDVKDAGALKYIEMIERTSAKLDRILLELLEAVKIRQEAVKVQDLTLFELVTEVLGGFSTRDDFKIAKIELAVPNDLHLRSDPGMIKIILSNLLDNAVKFRDPGKPQTLVRLSASREGNDIRIDVSDNGMGIPQELHERVFEMFFRGDPNSRGTGLGLYISRAAVNKLNGSLRLKSVAGQGSIFSVLIPTEYVQKDIIPGLKIPVESI
jgi:PAS domain S-box-containing protein